MYDEIADYYHLIYPDWDRAVGQQAEIFDGVLRTAQATAVRDLDAFRADCPVLDVACGIGTQALGLAALGYRVTASDLSPGAVARAKREAVARAVAVDFSVVDMGDCARAHGGGFGAVICADNALPHLPDEASVISALAAMRDCLRPDGVLIAGIRNYQPNDAADKTLWPYGTRGVPPGAAIPAGRYFVAQTRYWDEHGYDVAMYFVREPDADGPARVVAGKSRYFPFAVDELMRRMAVAGFDDVQRIDHLTAQPLVVARRR